MVNPPHKKILKSTSVMWGWGWGWGGCYSGEQVSGGRQGAGAWENRGREGNRSRERKGLEVGVPKGRKAGEIGGNYTTFHNISQSKKGKREEPKKKGAGAGIAGYGRREVWIPMSPPPSRLVHGILNLKVAVEAW